MKTKKFLSMILALAMIFSLSVAAFAEGEENNNNTFTGAATVKIPTIKVTVPKEANLFINPMGFEVKIATGEAAEDKDGDNFKTSNQIVSPVNIIKNSSPMDLNVSVIGSLVADDKNEALTISATEIGKDDTKNSVFIYAIFGEGDGDEKDGYTIKNAPTAYKAETEGIVALSTKAPKEAVKVGTVAKGDDKTPTLFGFQFQGVCNPNAKNDWHAGDKVTVTLAFTFKPVVAAPKA